MTDHKHPTAGFWIIVALVAVLVGYPLSFGPACWITSRTNVGVSAVPIVYRPITWGLSSEYAWRLDQTIRWYADIGAEPDWIWWSRSRDEDHSDWAWMAAL